MGNFKEKCEELEAEIQVAYESGTTLEEAERLAGKFLQAQLITSAELKKSDLDSRMRKSGVKAIRAAIYLDIVSKNEKKPSDTLLEQMVNSDDIVKGEQKSYDEAEADKDELERLYNVFREAHIFFRGISKGRFE